MDRAAFDAMLAQYVTPEVSGNGRVSWDKGVRCVIPEVRLYGKCQQDGTPTPDAPVEIKCNNGVFVARGGNLVDMPDIVSQKYSVDVKSYIQWYIDLPVGTTVTVSADAYTPYGAGVNVSAWRIVLKDKTLIYLWGGYTELESRVSYTHTKTVDFTMDDVKYSLWYLGYGVNQFDRWVKNVTANIGDADLGYTPYYDGGQATAPELMVAVDGSCQSTFDTQTGKLTDWWWPEIVLDGSEKWKAYSTASWIGFYAEDALPEKMLRNAHWSNMFDPLKKGAFVSSPHIWCGVNNQNVFVVASPSVGFSFYNSSLDDKGLANWKAHLAEHPLHVRVARNEPLVTYATPARLTMPPGAGQIIQVGGDVADCPISAKFLTHS